VPVRRHHHRTSHDAAGVDLTFEKAAACRTGLRSAVLSDARLDSCFGLPLRMSTHVYDE
jgi:hypothetical protein